MSRATWSLFALGSCVVVAASRPALARPRCATVEVVDRAGRPLADAEVTYYRRDPRVVLRRGSGPQVWTTDRAGRVCQEAFLPSGFLEVHAPSRLGGWCVANHVVRYDGWRAAEPVTRVTLPIKYIHRSRWRGRVVGADGKPIAGALVLVVRIHPRDTECSEVGPDGWRPAGGDGRFGLPSLPDGQLELRVSAPDQAEKTFFVTVPDRPHDLPVEPGARWTGRVIDPDGVPVEECSIALRSPGEIDVSTACNLDGTVGFDLRHIPPGTAKITVRLRDHPTLANRVFVESFDFVPDQQRQQDIRMPAGLTLAGQVVTLSGAPAAYATVTATSADRDRWFWEGALEVRADDQGRFQFHHVAAGQWEVFADTVTARPEDRQTVDAGTNDVKLVSRAGRRRPSQK